MQGEQVGCKFLLRSIKKAGQRASRRDRRLQDLTQLLAINLQVDSSQRLFFQQFQLVSAAAVPQPDVPQLACQAEFQPGLRCACFVQLLEQSQGDIDVTAAG